MCALLLSTEKIVRAVNRGQVYELVYKPENTLELALQHLRDALVGLYAASLELLANSSKLLSQNTAAQTIHAILHPGGTESLFKKLDDLETQLGRDVQACQSAWSAAADKRLTGLLHGLDAPITRIDDGVGTLLEIVDWNEQKDILEWISLVPYRKHHDEVKMLRTRNTCEWLLGDDKFREWEKTSLSVILWLQGSPGAGKTYLTSKVIDQIDSLPETCNNEGFAFFYCNRNEEERRKPLSVLRSYVRQLSTAVRSPGHMRKQLRDLYRETIRNGSDLGLDACKQQLLESVNLYLKTTLVLDALDECEPELRGQLVNMIEDLLSKSERPLKVFISSRPDGDIRDRFASLPNIEIQATDNQDDIEKFVNEEIVKHRRWHRISPSLREEVVTTLLGRSGGMFQWAYLQIKELLELQTEQTIRDRLGKLPEDLEGAYDEIYGKIQSRHKYEKAFADRAFKWVMCACKPLGSEELLSAVRLDPDTDNSHLDERVDEGLLLELCNNLLVLDSQREVWRFSHLSVREYFEENHWGLWQAHCHAAKVCLGLLIETHKNPTSKGKPQDIFDLAHPFQKYLRHHWMIHVRSYDVQVTDDEQEADLILARLLRTFLGSPRESSAQYQGWYDQVASERPPWSSALSEVRKEEISPKDVPIFAICRFSFYTLLRDWWDSAEIEVLQINDNGKNLLVLAAIASCKPICKNLVKQGIPVNMVLQSGGYGSALAAAACSGKTETVKFLVQEGAEVNMVLQSGDYGSALAVAVAQAGETATVKFLIQEGAKM
ncbi:hypothetical protein QBC33DRAFT_460474 [Phialemonium atrogriseum]|uniref:NACHT domain-containing protein n=1 Tax=Phialemonium atrogriseum TaxID=1093897 RepID=A0AAJ0BTS0_9PEZI|nr:uncharacterized protein QBC33DRAFT_460474 [Phialemonium atrogriseum]KAK1762907.1 hypothetical protein QBC33DRAFT_460474 [Phialemonium atrogriseum]